MNRTEQPRGHWRHWVAGGGFLALAALFYAPLLLALRTFPDGDFTHHFLPFSLYQQQALRAGELPLWNPYTYAGHPFLADTQAAVFYPLSNLLLLVTLPWPAVGNRLYFLQVEAVLHVALAGFFVYLLVNALTRQRLAAFAAGCAFAFSGYLTGYPPLQLAVLRTAIWLPLLLYLLLRALDEPYRWRWWIGAAFAYAVAFLAGHPQTFLHSSYAAAAWALFLLVSTRRQQDNGTPTSRLLAQLLGLGGFALLALGIVAVQLLPSLEFSGLSVRANVDYAYVSGGFPLQDSWQILLPGVLTQFSPLYVGVVGIGLVLIGLIQGGLRDWQSKRLSSVNLPISQSPNPSISQYPIFFAILALIALLLSYGDNGFLYSFAYHYAPGWNLFRGQERVAFLVALGLCVLIGSGVAALPRLGYGARRGLGLLYAMLVAGGTYFFGLFWQLMGRSAISDNSYLLLAGLTIGLALTVVVLLLLPGWSRRRTLGVIGLLVVNLFWANLTTNLAPFGPARKTILAPEMEALGQAVTTDGAGAEGIVGRVYNEFRLYEDYGIRQGIEDAWGSSPLRLARYAALFDSFPLDRMWRLTGVSHVVTWRQELFEPSTLLAEFPQATDMTYVHRLTEANPRAWLVQQIQSASDEQALTLLADHTFDLEEIALLPADTLTDTATLPAGTGQVQLAQMAAGHLRVTVDSSTGGLLILSENWMPGWQVQNVACGGAGGACQLDNSKVSSVVPFTAQRVDLTLIGVLVPAGVVTFELVYWPQSVQLGLWLSGGTLLVLGLLGGWHGWTRPAEQCAMKRGYVRLLLLVVILLGWGLRLWRLDDQELRGDEVFGYFFSLRPLDDMVQATIELQEPHPIASYLVQQRWLAWAGHSEFTLRFSSAWFGLLAVALLWRLANALLLMPRTALLATLLLASSPYAIWHSQDARMYSMSLALTTASTWLMIGWLQRQRQAWAIAYGVISWVALHTHYFSVFVLVAQNLFVLIRTIQQPRLRFTFINWLAIQATIAFFYGPWLLQVQTTLTDYRGNGDSPALGAMLWRAGSVFLVGESVPAAQRLWWALLTGLLLLGGAITLARGGANERRTLLLLGLYLGVPLVTTWWSATQRPIFNERYLVAAAPPFYLLLAVGLTVQPKRRCGFHTARSLLIRKRAVWKPHLRLPTDQLQPLVATALLLVVLSGVGLSLNRYYTDPAYSKTRGWRTLAATLTQWSSQLPPATVQIAQNFPDPTLWYYYQGDVAHVVLPPQPQDEAGAWATVQQLRQAGIQRVLLPLQPAPNWDDHGIAASALGVSYTLAFEAPVGAWPVQLYAAPPTSLQPATVPFTNGVTLTGFAVQPTTLSPNNVLTVQLGWQGTQRSTKGSEKVFVQVLNAGGQLVAQADRPLQVAADPTVVTLNTYGILVPATLPAGEYHLIVGLYDPTGAGMPRILTSDGRDAVPLLVMDSASS